MSIDFRGVAPLLQVFDMPGAVHFYRDVLGFVLTDHSQALVDGSDHFGWALLKFAGCEVMLNTAYDEGQRPLQPDPARVAAHGDTCLYFGCEDLDGAYQHLRAHGVKVQPPKVAPYGMKQLYVSDPDGYGLCFQWPVSQERYDQWVEAYGLEPKTVR
jgi:glyoxylase I family protein